MPDKPAPKKTPKKPAAKGAGVGSFLTKQVGPLPAWGWAAVGLVAALVWRGKTGSAAASSSTGAAGQDFGTGYDAGYNAGVNYSGPGPGSGGGGPGSAIPATPGPPAPTATPAGMAPSSSTGGQLPIFAPLGYSLTPGELEAVSAYQQPQNQPSVNPYVSSAPVVQASPGTVLGAATGTGTRYVTPWTGDAPSGPVYSYTYG